eukprot:TRINITY_DN1928_c0_g1_i10.p1 TRINITY_DN1928_c0_g1~~TRINITY_DN1928_c0_g1_i10.p1  ORF type:complete len:113 (-),score=8.26 TRINITY_DN1928_c0_g1_i10:55-393(-)
MRVFRRFFVCTEAGRVRRLEYQMLAGIDVLAFLVCVSTPQDKHDIFLALIDLVDDGVSELVPAKGFVAVGLVGAHSQASVQEQHTALGPLFQVTVLGNHETIDVLLQLFVNI